MKNLLLCVFHQCNAFFFHVRQFDFSIRFDFSSFYFIRLNGSELFYSISAIEEPLAVILNAGDRVAITFQPGGESILTSVAVEKQ